MTHRSSYQPLDLIRLVSQHVPGHVDDQPPEGGELAATSHIVLPVVHTKVVFLAVALDGNLQGEIGEIDLSDELASVISDDELPVGLRQATPVKKLDEPSLERTARYRKRQLASVKDAAHQLDPWTPLSAQPIQRLSQWPLGDQPAPASLI